MTACFSNSIIHIKSGSRTIPPPAWPFRKIASWHGDLGIKLVPIEQDRIGRLRVQDAKFRDGQVLFTQGAVFMSQVERELLVTRTARRTTSLTASALL